MHGGHTVRCLIVAEDCVNHNGDLGMALDLVDLAIKAGADFINFQTFLADRLATAAIGFQSCSSPASLYSSTYSSDQKIRVFTVRAGGALSRLYDKLRNK